MDERDDAAYPPLKIERLTGDEPLRNGGEILSVGVREFWQWSASDLVSNLTRGRLAEFIVAHATGIDVSEGVRNEWDAFDFTTPDGVKVEVKSTAYLQSWHQTQLSTIGWRAGPTRKWDAATNLFESDARWQADVYVFALFTQQEKTNVNPLDVARWQFFVVPVRKLYDRVDTRVITLSAMEVLAGNSVGYDDLATAIKSAAGVA